MCQTLCASVSKSAIAPTKKTTVIVVGVNAGIMLVTLAVRFAVVDEMTGRISEGCILDF